MKIFSPALFVASLVLLENVASTNATTDQEVEESCREKHWMDVYKDIYWSNGIMIINVPGFYNESSEKPPKNTGAKNELEHKLLYDERERFNKVIEQNIAECIENANEEEEEEYDPSSAKGMYNNLVDKSNQASKPIENLPLLKKVWPGYKEGSKTSREILEQSKFKKDQQ